MTPRPTSAMALQLMESVRASRADMLRLVGATSEHGAPTALADGIHIAAANEDHLAAIRRLNPDPSTIIRLRDVVAPESLATWAAAELLQELHRNDTSVPNGLIPAEGDVHALDFGEAFMVRDGMAIGHLLLFDSRGTPGEPYDLSRVPCFDTISNAWTAHAHRHRGVARGLLAHVRERYPIVELQRPFSPAGAAWAHACAPDLIDIGRNSLCPCGSGTKYKRCHGSVSA